MNNIEQDLKFLNDSIKEMEAIIKDINNRLNIVENKIEELKMKKQTYKEE